MQAVKLRALGQVEVPAAVITAAITLVTSALTGVVTYTVAQAQAVAEFRATVDDHSREIDRLRSLPVEDLKALPARFEVVAAASEQTARSVDRIEALLRGSRAERVRQAVPRP